MSSGGVGVPVKILHESVGHIVTVELKTGETYRGTLLEAEDNMNCQLTNLTFTARDGRVSEIEHVFIRGSKVRFLILPDMLKNAPMFKRVDPKIKGRGAGIAALGPVGRGRGRGRGAGRGRGEGGGGRGRT